MLVHSSSQKTKIKMEMMDPGQPKSHRALAIPEIVILILHQLDICTLLTSRRVCHLWADLICHTRTLQEALYLSPIENEEYEDEGSRNLNTLLAETFPFLRMIISLNVNDADNYSILMKHVASAGPPSEDLDLQDMELLKSASKRNQYLRPEASWRRMFTHQPPSLKVSGLYNTYSCGDMKDDWAYHLDWTQFTVVGLDHGLRKGPLIDWMVIMAGFYDKQVITLHRQRLHRTSSSQEQGEGPMVPSNPDSDFRWQTIARDFDLILIMTAMEEYSEVFDDSGSDESDAAAPATSTVTTSRNVPDRERFRRLKRNDKIRKRLCAWYEEMHIKAEQPDQV